MATGLVGTKQSVSTPNYEGGKDSRLNYLKDPVFGSPEYDIDEHYDTQPTDVPAEHLSPEYDPRGGDCIGSIDFRPLPEATGEQGAGRTIDIPRENQAQLFNRLGSVAEKATNVVAAVGEAMPGIAKDTKDALGGLIMEEVGLGQILNALGGKTEKVEKPAPPEKHEEILAMSQAREIVAQAIARNEEQDYQQKLAMALNILGRAEITDEDKDLLKMSTSLERKYILTLATLHLLGQAQRDRQKAILKAKNSTNDSAHGPSLKGTRGMGMDTKAVTAGEKAGSGQSAMSAIS